MHLAALKGKPVVVYFYPKDEDSGMHQGGLLFSRRLGRALAKKGVVMIGVSADSADSHRASATAPQSSPSCS